MKLCIIGATGHTNYVLQGLDSCREIKLSAIAPGCPEEPLDKLIKTCTDLRLTPKVYNDYRTMLDEIKPDIAAVACFFGDHAAVNQECLKRKIHVFSEKPVATELSDLEKVKATYRQSGVHFAAMFGIRFRPWFLTIKKAVDEGAIGKVRLMNAQKSYRLGKRGNNYKNRQQYGGTIPWVGSHAVDWLHWLSGEQFTAVYATHSKLYNENNGDLEISALCHFTFTNQVYGSVNIDYLRPANAASHDDDRIRIAGTKGVIEIRQEKVYLINDHTPGIVEIPLVPEQNIFADFIGRILGKNPGINTPDDAFIITEACLKARESADTGKIMKLNEEKL